MLVSSPAAARFLQLDSRGGLPSDEGLTMRETNNHLSGTPLEFKNVGAYPLAVT